MKKAYVHWTEIRLPNATIWRENFSGDTYAEYYLERDAAFGTALATLSRTMPGKGPRKWAARCRNVAGSFRSFLFPKREEAEEKIHEEISRLLD